MPMVEVIMKIIMETILVEIMAILFQEILVILVKVVILVMVWILIMVEMVIMEMQVVMKEMIKTVINKIIIMVKINKMKTAQTQVRKRKMKNLRQMMLMMIINEVATKFQTNNEFYFNNDPQNNPQITPSTSLMNYLVKWKNTFNQNFYNRGKINQYNLNYH